MTIEIPTELETQLEQIAQRRDIRIEELIIGEVRRQLEQFEKQELANDERSRKHEEELQKSEL